jgi:hypothetical protein
MKALKTKDMITKELKIKQVEDILREYFTLNTYTNKEYHRSHAYTLYDIAERIYNSTIKE